MCKCCPCYLFDACCLKKLASIPDFVADDDATLVFASNAVHNNDLKELLGKDCYNALCQRSNNLKNAVDWAFAGTYAVGENVIYIDICYISLINSNIGNNPASSPTFWALSGPTQADINLIAAMQQYAAYMVEWYYRTKRSAGDIEPAGVHVKMPEYAQLPAAAGVQNTLKMILGLAQNERQNVVDFLVENIADYPCYVPKITPCDKPEKNIGYGFGFVTIGNKNTTCNKKW